MHMGQLRGHQSFIVAPCFQGFSWQDRDVKAVVNPSAWALTRRTTSFGKRAHVAFSMPKCIRK